jgi:hypothetical protein
MTSRAKPVFHDPSKLGQWTGNGTIEGTSLQFRKEVEALAHNNLLNDKICQAVAESKRNHTLTATRLPVNLFLLADQVAPRHVVPSQWDTRTGTWIDNGRALNERNGTAVTGIPVFTMTSPQSGQQQLVKQPQVYSSSCILI